MSGHTAPCLAARPPQQSNIMHTVRVKMRVLHDLSDVAAIHFWLKARSEDGDAANEGSPRRIHASGRANVFALVRVSRLSSLPALLGLVFFHCGICGIWRLALRSPE